MALLIKADGTKEVVHPANGKAFTLEELQKYVGGYIELLYALRLGECEKLGMASKGNNTLEMYINEEGKINDLPPNLIATILYTYGGHDIVCGDVLLANRSESKQEGED